MVRATDSKSVGCRFESGRACRGRSKRKEGNGAVAKLPQLKEKEKADYIGRVRNFLSEVAAEQKKIVWPTREALIQATSTVTFIIVVLSIYLAIIDMGLSKLFELIT